MFKPVWVFLLCIPALVYAQESLQPKRVETSDAQNSVQLPAQAILTVRSSTEMVLVPVSVRDASGLHVTNLRIEDFVVSENGTEAPLVHFGKPELTRLEIVLVFDLTSSLWYYFDLVKESASGFVQAVYRPGDTVAVVGISSRPEVLLKRNDSLPEILEGLKNLPRFGAATAFFDAIIIATRLFPDYSDPETRRVLVVLSDGEDNLSSRTEEDALQKLQKTDSLFYSINPGASVDRLNRISQRGQKCMETMAEQTGGTAFMAPSLKNLSVIYSRIAEELQVQYLLGYVSPLSTDDGLYRSIDVSIPGRPDLKVRARKGYYAPKPKNP